MQRKGKEVKGIDLIEERSQRGSRSDSFYLLDLRISAIENLKMFEQMAGALKMLIQLPALAEASGN